MQNTKGQAEGAGMVIVVAFIILAVIGVVQLIAVTITSQVSANIEGNLALDTKTTVNETIGIQINAGADNSTRLDQDGFVTASAIVANLSNGSEIYVINTHYTITESGAEDDTEANFTWILPLANFSNTTGTVITYDTEEETEYHTVKDSLVDTNLASFELGGTAQIVFAATVVLVAVFGILFIMKGRG